MSGFEKYLLMLIMLQSGLILIIFGIALMVKAVNLFD